MYYFIWCLCTFHICAYRTCYHHYPNQVRTGPRTPHKNNHESRADIEFCLKTTYFQFQGRLFEQLQGVAMGSPISPIVANLYMEDFEIKAINWAVYPPRIRKRFVDETCVVIDSARKKKFLEHINNMDPYIQFTTEDAKPDGSLPFLDTIVMPHPDNSLLTSVYRKAHIQICSCSGTVTTTYQV